MTQQTTQAVQTDKAAPREAWDTIAADYDRVVTPRNSELSTEALRLAGLRPGDRFLDVAAGSGALSFAAARLGARVVAADWSPHMIEHFRARAREANLEDAEGHVMDCHALRFPDDRFDFTASQFGVMLVPDQATAFKEMVRVTRPGGRVMVVAFSTPDRFEMLRFFIAAIHAVVPDFQGLPNNPPPLEFQLADPEEFGRRLTAAGLREVHVNTDHEERLEIEAGRELWDWCLASNPIPGMLLAKLSDDQKLNVREELERKIAERKNGHRTVALTAAINIGLGTK